MDHPQPVLQEEEPLSKKLRCSEPDLKIIVKYTNTKDEEVSKEYQMHSVLMANLSEFIDAALSSEMKESSTREIMMHVDPNRFEKALKVLQDSSAGRMMTANDAIDLVGFYDEYSFSGGLKLCDDVLTDFLQKNTMRNVKISPVDFHRTVNAAAIAFRFNLPTAKGLGIDCMEERLENEASTYGRAMFSAEHIEKLHPLFKQGVFWFDCLGVTAEEMDSPLFPKWFVENSAKLLSSHLHKELQLVVVSGTQTAVDGVYKWDYGSDSFLPIDRTNLTWNGQDTNFEIKQEFGDEWSIRHQGFDGNYVGEADLWECPFTENLPMPPLRQHWIAVDEVAKQKGMPEISYKPNDE